MTRPPSVIPSTRLNLVLPREIRSQLDRYLYDIHQGKVPMGAYQRFFTQLIHDYLLERNTKVG